MEGNNSKTQGIALGLVLMAVVVTAGGFLYMSRQKEQARAEMQKAQIQEQAPAQSETGLPQAATAATKAAPAGGGLKSTGCPVTDVGAALGVEVLKGHASCSVGSGAGIEAVSPTGIGGKAGLKERDVVVYANKTRTECPRDLLGEISASWGKEITLTVERAGKQVKVVLPAATAKAAADTKASAK